MSEAITHARFAERISYLASHISSWAGSCLTLPEEHAKPMRASSVERFIDEVQSRIDFLREDLAVLQLHEQIESARTRPHGANDG